MGLCKCPKRKVTNQFCFEHRVNVCEHCMVQKHPKCVVQSYLLWLQDSDYTPRCEFCTRDLAEEVCVRLVCYHVYHWVCLDEWARGLPSDTAPAGYTCKNCHAGLFPPDNLVSPVADALREMLSDVNWARAGLGLPLLEDTSERRPEFTSASADANGSRQIPPSGPRPPPEGENSHGVMERPSVHSGGGSSTASSGGDQILTFDTPTSRLKTSAPLEQQHQQQQQFQDPDDDKYKRKSATELLLRWIRTFLVMGPGARRRVSKTQRYMMGLLILFLTFLTLMVVMNYLSRSGDYEDPMLEPMNNPNIHVGVA